MYAADVTANGIDLFAKILANKATLTISRVMVGSGRMQSGQTIADMTDMIQPVATATSDEPTAKGGTLNFTVEYRSDLNGGLDAGFYIREYGVYVRDPTQGGIEVLVFYGNLDDYPQWVSAYSEGEAVDVRRFPVCIAIGQGQTVTLEYQPTAFMTSENVTEIVETTVLPEFLSGDVADAIAAHNTSTTAHPDICNQLTGLDSRLNLLELMYNTDVNDNQFNTTFEDLDGTTVTGVWNKEQARIEF